MAIEKGLGRRSRSRIVVDASPLHLRAITLGRRIVDGQVHAVAWQTRQARILLQQVLDKYPKSEAATLAAALLRDLK